MKLSAQEEYGLRCLLQVARRPHGQSVTIPDIAEAESVSPHNVARYLGTLRKHGIVDSERGQHGGYTLARNPDTIIVADVLSALGGPLYDPSFCNHFTGAGETCQHTAVDCSIRGLWMQVQNAVDDVLSHTTLQDLLDAADNMAAMHVEQPPSCLLQVEGS
ncbi:MAG TPA: Rrf2 family transcriptional regulator [Candidatus Latescibacteria bacterium]|nr:transcriptional regulator [Gemmatimonadaceae bacterium]MDP6015605.1 Rrf2 family transcriptional regulator [Candidatus Latescibacterota bacterium]HJP31190.1 Rrf2 family transcriptional regulator [Candidatus Latescibacterota bacterium]